MEETRDREKEKSRKMLPSPFLFLASYRRSSPSKKRGKKNSKLALTATFPWACIRRRGTPRGPPLSGALPRRAPRKEVPPEGGGEQQFHSSTTTTTSTTTAAKRATDDDGDAETEEARKHSQQLSLSFRAVSTTTAGRCRDSSRWSKRASSSKPASFFRSFTSFFSFAADFWE